jgi:hypothetical protein
MLSVLVGSLIAALGTLIGLVAGKESKISEFRQVWIDELRHDLSEAISCSFAVARGSAQADSSLVDQQLDLLLIRIRLRLNAKEKLHRSLLVELGALRDKAEAGLNLGQQSALVSEVSQLVLKEEWDRVKTGEWKYRWLLTSAVGLAVLVLAVLARHFESTIGAYIK